MRKKENLMDNDTNEKDKGYTFRTIQAILYMIILFYNGFIPLSIQVRIPIICVALVFTVLQFVTVFVGRKAKWANVLSIILGGLLLVYGICGIIGGVKGIQILKSSTEQTEEKPKDNNVALNNTVDATVAKPCSPVEITELKDVDFDNAQPKQARKGNKVVMILLTISYSLLLICGILLSAVPSVSNIIAQIGICKQEQTRAYGITLGVMWVTFVPAIGYYFAILSPFELSKKVRIILIGITTGLLVAMNFVFFVVINGVRLPVNGDTAAVKEFFDGSDRWFIPASTVFASIAIALCYLLFLFKGNVNGGGNAIVKIVVRVMNLKNNHPDIFILIASILLTWLAHFVAFILAIAIMVIFVGIIILVLLKAFSFDKTIGTFTNAAFGGEFTTGMKQYTFTNDMGCEQTIYSSNGHDFYNFDGSFFGYSNDNGKTIILDGYIEGD